MVLSTAIASTSTTGCQFGKGCHFLHYVPYGLKVVSQMQGGNHAIPSAPRNQGPPPSSYQDGPSPTTVKRRICNKYNTAEGFKFGDICRISHGEWELGKSITHEDPRGMGGPMGGGGGRYGGSMEHHSPGLGAATASFRASTTTKISFDASLSGAIIDKGGVNS